MRKVVCFGEILWDVLPHGRFLGGAPLNVAYHLARLGCAPRLVSAVGRDALGDEALAAIARAGLGAESIARHAHVPTGTVNVTLDAAGQASYVIAEPVAWDEISVAPAPGVRPAALVFGSLALRRPANRAALRARLAAAPGLRVCDLNLRAPHDDLAPLAEFLGQLDVLKLNEAEARRLMPPALAAASVATHAAHLAATLRCATVCITLGADGALLRHGEKTFRASAPAVAVRDTIGAGDAFTAALLDGILRARPQPDWPALLVRAAALGAFVASRDGAQPGYVAEELFAAST